MNDAEVTSPGLSVPTMKTAETMRGRDRLGLASALPPVPQSRSAAGLAMVTANLESVGHGRMIGGAVPGTAPVRATAPGRKRG
jgi:hypothetical protein